MKDAKLKYGKDYDAHMGEIDHLVPLKLMHEKLKNSPFIAPEDAKNIANDEDNLLLTSRRVNNAKRAKTNAEFAEDSDFLKKKGLPVSKKMKDNLRWEGTKAEIKQTLISE